MKSLISLFAVAALLAGNAQAIDVAKVNQALASSDRPAADKERDDSRQPAAVLDFLGLEEGDTVLDIIASTGWYTEVLSRAVGPNGKVYMQNSAGSMERNAEGINARLANDRLPNVEKLSADLSDFGLQANSVDFAITALNFHDVYNGNPEAAQTMLNSVKTVLKPGGVFGIIDHKGTFGADNQALHRIALENVIMAATEAGFAVVGYSDVLHNAEDDHTVGPFDPSLGRDTDRLVVKLMKM